MQLKEDQWSCTYGTQHILLKGKWVGVVYVLYYNQQIHQRNKENVQIASLLSWPENWLDWSVLISQFLNCMNSASNLN